MQRTHNVDSSEDSAKAKGDAKRVSERRRPEGDANERAGKRRRSRPRRFTETVNLFYVDDAGLLKRTREEVLRDMAFGREEIMRHLAKRQGVRIGPDDRRLLLAYAVSLIDRGAIEVGYEGGIESWHLSRLPAGHHVTRAVLGGEPLA